MGNPDLIHRLRLIAVLDIKFIFEILCQYCGNKVIPRLPGIIFPDIIIDSKEFFFLDTVIFYHEGMLR